MSDSTTAGERRRRAGEAGHAGDEAGARRLLADPDPGVRATALGALVRMGRSSEEDFADGLADPHPTVRRRAATEASTAALDLVPVLADPEPLVAEAAAWALGERGAGAGPAEITALADLATTHPDALCREAAVAALGAIGHPAGLPAILAATTDKPAVRRRAVLALAPFEGPEVDAALQRALADRDWQVRQAAEDLSR
ncbi:MAG: HEAT repeat domain-containing protein [Actinobacteria bacterium]|nr:HEAT repeat domain-containing protein [Actinomycetota bacterium]